jgi:Ca-activated chloride channel family protein
VAEGNRAYRDGKYAEAAAAYEKASVDLPEAAEIYFNKGTAYYGQEDYAKAVEALEAAALKTRDLALEARCNFNLGNCAFRQAERQKDSDLQKAVDGYRRSIRHYQEALKLDPELADAAHNIEVVRLLLKDLLDKLNKQQQQQKQQQEKLKEIAEKLKQLIERQQKANERRETLGKEEAEKGESDALKQNTQGLADDQSDIRDDTKALSEEMAKAVPPAPLQQPQQPAQPPSPIAQARPHVDAAAAEQALAAERLRKHQLEEAKPPQDKALEELLKALAKLAGQPQGGQGQQKQDPQPQPKDQQQAAKPRDEKARDILKEEKDNRDRRRQRARSGHRPVDKDW